MQTVWRSMQTFDDRLVTFILKCIACVVLLDPFQLIHADVRAHVGLHIERTQLKLSTHSEVRNTIGFDETWRLQAKLVSKSQIFNCYQQKSCYLAYCMTRCRSPTAVSFIETRLTSAATAAAAAAAGDGTKKATRWRAKVEQSRVTCI